MSFIKTGIWGTPEEFEEKYGKTTSDGVPRQGDDYTHLHHPDELALDDKIKKEIEVAVYTILHPFGE